GALAIFPPQVTLDQGQSNTFVIVGGTPPYNIVANGGTANPTIVAASGGSFIYTAGAVAGTFTIIATDSANQVAQATVTISPTSAQVATIVLVANPSSVNGVTGGTSALTATVLNATNQPIPNVSVLFETDTGTVNPITVTTNASGQAVSTLTIAAGTPAGVAQVTASAGGKSDSINVNIVTSSTGSAGPPADIFVDLFANRSGDNNDGTCTTILSALVVDAKGNPVNDGTQVAWAVTPTILGNIPVSVTSPSFTNQNPLCDTSSYTNSSTGTGLPLTPQPGDALTCLKYPRSASSDF